MNVLVEFSVRVNLYEEERERGHDRIAPVTAILNKYPQVAIGTVFINRPSRDFSAYLLFLPDPRQMKGLEPPDPQ